MAQYHKSYSRFRSAMIPTSLQSSSLRAKLSNLLTQSHMAGNSHSSDVAAGFSLQKNWSLLLLRLFFLLMFFSLSNPAFAQVSELWVARYDGPATFRDYGAAIAVDGTGNVYVTGWSDGGNSSRDYATIKYDTNGNQLWVARYNGTGNDLDYATAITVDGSGNVYVTGSSFGIGTNSDYATIKYDPNGNQLWEVRYDGPGNNLDYATSIGIDGSGAVYVTGYSGGGSSTGSDYATIKYDTNGNQLWIARYNGTGSGADTATAIAVDLTGNVYVTGDSDDMGLHRDYATIKYDANGNQVWVARYDGPSNGTDFATAIVIDRDNNAYVTGWSDGGNTGNDYATIKYDLNGNMGSTI